MCDMPESIKTGIRKVTVIAASRQSVKLQRDLNVVTIIVAVGMMATLVSLP